MIFHPQRWTPLLSEIPVWPTVRNVCKTGSSVTREGSAKMAAPIRISGTAGLGVRTYPDVDRRHFVCGRTVRVVERRV